MALFPSQVPEIATTSFGVLSQKYLPLLGSFSKLLYPFSPSLHPVLITMSLRRLFHGQQQTAKNESSQNSKHGNSDFIYQLQTPLQYC